MARLRIIAVGRLKRDAAQALVEDYLTRAQPLLRRLGLAGVQMRELPESRAREAATRRREEGRAILAAAGEAASLLVLDERGEQLTSRAFAERLRRLAKGGRGEVAIVIGGPDGLDEEVRRRAAALVAFGRMTWPHRLVRAMLAEQLYRAGAIAAGLPYHRD